MDVATASLATSAALLKLDAGTWIIMDCDWPSQVQLLNKLWPFPIEVAMISPNSVAPARLVVLEMARHSVKPCANGWFQTSFEVAISIFGRVVSGGRCDDPDLRPDTPAYTPKVVEGGSNHADEAMDPLRIDETPPQLDDLTEIGVTLAEQGVGTLWEHVESSIGQAASKATDIRAAITAKLGKQKAAVLLSQTKMSVGRDGQGKNIRVLRVGEMTLKLK